MSNEALDLLLSCFESSPSHRPNDAGGLAALLEALPRLGAARLAGTSPDLPLVEPASTPSLKATQVSHPKGGAPSERARHGEQNREGEAPSEPVLCPGERNQVGEPNLKPARMELRPPESSGGQFAPSEPRVQHQKAPSATATACLCTNR